MHVRVDGGFPHGEMISQFRSISSTVQTNTTTLLGAGCWARATDDLMVLTHGHPERSTIRS